jgi:solute carrier family 39 (zinc transporter), member 13
MANGIDNFTHGLAVAGSFLVSTRVGLLTTTAILLHEIPHEVADFAILLRAGEYTSRSHVRDERKTCLLISTFCCILLGFGRWDAARAQLGTASVGLAGALTALGANGTEGMADGRFTSWILPFTAGGFLHIALVTGIDVTPLSLFGSEGHQCDN